MPSFEKHLKQAKHNEDLACRLVSKCKGEFNDWVITTCFYSVVHFVEAMTAKSDVLMVPSADTKCRYPVERPVLVKKKGIEHTSQLSKIYGKSGHELRNCVIKHNGWFYGFVGTVCSYLRSLSQEARYECQDESESDAQDAFDKLKKAECAFNSWAIKKHIIPITEEIKQ